MGMAVVHMVAATRAAAQRLAAQVPALRKTRSMLQNLLTWQTSCMTLPVLFKPFLVARRAKLAQVKAYMKVTTATR